MDIEPMTMGERKTFELIQKNEHRLSNRSTDHVNRSTIFEFFYFWSIFFLTASFFFDITVYFCFYQEKINRFNNYDGLTFFLRIITDGLFIIPLLIFIRFALTSSTKTYIVGIIVFLPQFILNIISIIKILKILENSNEKKENNNNNYNDTEKELMYMYFTSFANNDTSNETNTNITDKVSLEAQRIALKVSPIINIIFYIITVLFTYLKIFKNF
jgi:hypothetical protein